MYRVYMNDVYRVYMNDVYHGYMNDVYHGYMNDLYHAFNCNFFIMDQVKSDTAKIVRVFPDKYCVPYVSQEGSIDGAPFSNKITQTDGRICLQNRLLKRLLSTSYPGYN